MDPRMNPQFYLYRSGRRRATLGAFGALLVLSSCGGGGGDSADTTDGVGPTATANDTLAAMPDYVGTQLKSVVAVEYVAPEPSERATATNKTGFGKYGYLRPCGILDVNGDGLDDIFLAPTFFDQKPDLPVEIWVNKGNGTFENRTNEWFLGSIPTTGNVVTVPLIADFNGDGKPDIFLSDSGQELADCSVGTACPGGINHLFLSDASGRLRDASMGLANNLRRFNHVTTSVGDINDDGHIDIAVPVLSESTGIVGDGIVLQINKGDGTFADESSWISDEIAYVPYSYQISDARPLTYHRQSTGATALADVDGDGKPELINCSYTTPDSYTKQKTIRFSRWNASTSKLGEVGRFVLSGELAQIAGATTSGIFSNDDGTLGCAGVWVADVDGDGIKDLMVLWERWDGTYIQLLRGQGGWRFVDMTTSSFGGYRTSFTDGPFIRTVGPFAFKDINGDGFPDIIGLSGGVNETRLATGMPTSYINDGHGNFSAQKMVADGAGISKAEVEVLTGCNFCNHAIFYGRFVPRSDGRKTLDILLILNP